MLMFSTIELTSSGIYGLTFAYKAFTGNNQTLLIFVCYLILSYDLKPMNVRSHNQNPPVMQNMA